MELERRELNGKLMTAVAVLEAEMRDVKSELKEINLKIDSIKNTCSDKCMKIFLSREVFDEVMSPIKKVVYGTVGIMLAGVIVAVISMVIKK